MALYLQQRFLASRPSNVGDEYGYAQTVLSRSRLPWRVAFGPVPRRAMRLVVDVDSFAHAVRDLRERNRDLAHASRVMLEGLEQYLRRVMWPMTVLEQRRMPWAAPNGAGAPGSSAYLAAERASLVAHIENGSQVGPVGKSEIRGLYRFIAVVGVSGVGDAKMREAWRLLNLRGPPEGIDVKIEIGKVFGIKLYIPDELLPDTNDAALRIED